MKKVEADYFSSLDIKTREYFEILYPKYAKLGWLNDYANTTVMQRLKHVSMVCGGDFLACWDTPHWYSTLDHSVACALIVYNFTKSRTQALSALFHDISTPTLKHCVDFMNGDALTQESTEAPTYSFIKNSKEIRALLKKDQIRPSAVSDYHKFPIADNDTPRLSSDRLEYSFMNSQKVRDYGVKMSNAKIRRYYQNLTVGKNEDGVSELAFLDFKIAEDFIKDIHKLWHNWHDERFCLVGDTYAELLRMCVKAGDFTPQELYELTDQEVIDKILSSKNPRTAALGKKFFAAKKVYFGEEAPKGKYYVKTHPIKRRYIDPLVCVEADFDVKAKKSHRQFIRLSSISPTAKAYVDELLASKAAKYVWLGFKKP